MSGQDEQAEQAADLRARAEEVAAQSPDSIEALSEEEAQQVLHDLRVHQIELEMQNEELRRAQEELDALRARYFDLYDLAPVGYCILSEKGLILEANLTAAKLLDAARTALVKQPITRFILHEDQDIYYHHRKALFETGAPQAFDLRMLKKDGTAFWACLEATAAQDVDGAPVCRVVMTDTTERKRNEEHLERFKNVVSATTDGIAFLDETFRYVIVNDAYERFSGINRERFLGRTVAEYLGEDVFRAIVKPHLDSCLQGEVINYQEWFDYPTLGRRYVDITYSPYRDAAGRIEGVVANTRDITERKRAEEALRSSEVHLRAVFSSSGDYIMVLDRDHRIEFVNRAEPGVDSDAIIGMRLFELVNTNDQARVKGHLDRVVQSGEPQQYDTTCRRPDGTEVHFSSLAVPLIDSGGLSGSVVNSRDVTDLKRAQEMLAVTQQAVDAATEGIAITDASHPDNPVIYVNRGFEKLTGYSAEEVLGRNMRLLQGSKTSPATVKAMGDAIRAGRECSLEVMNYRKDGSAFWNRVSSAPVPTESGSPRHFVSVLSDISDRKQAEQALAKERDRAQHYLDTVEAIIVALDTEGRVTLLNRKGCDLLGYEEGELVGQMWFEKCLPQPEGMKTVYPFFQRLVSGELAAAEYFENPALSREGERIEIAWHNALLLDDEGSTVGTLSAGEDITERKKVQQALQDMADRYALAQRAAGAGVWDWDVVTGHIEWSPIMFDLFGLDPDNWDASFEAWRAALHPEDRDVAERSIELALSQRTMLDSDYRVVLRDGRIRWINAVGEGVYDEQGQAMRMSGICLDITERKRAEETLRESEARLLVAVDAGNIGLWDWDLQTNQVWYSPEWKRQIGYEDHEIANAVAEWESRIHPDDLDRSLRTVRAFIEKPWPDYHLEFRFRHKDGSYRWILTEASLFYDEQGKPIRMLGSHVDITERKETENALQKAELRYQLALRAARAGAWEWTFDTNKTVWSDYTYRQMGLEPGSIDSNYENWLACIHPDDRAMAERACAQAMESRGRLDFVCRCLWPNGTVRWINDIGEVVLDESGEPTGMYGLQIDITDRKRAEEALQESREQLFQAEKMAALGTLISGVAHEINNPNSFIMLNTPVLEQVFRAVLPLLEEKFQEEGDFRVGKMPYSKVKEGVPRLLSGIREGSRQIKQYVSELRDFGRQEGSGYRELLDLRKVTDSAVMLTENLIAKSTSRFEFNKPESLPSIRAHPQRIEQVVINLIQNACQALTSPEQALTLDIAHDAEENTVLLTVRDEGAGMSEETLAHLFDPFFTTRQGTGGTGLGLSVSKRIADEHGGRLEFESELGMGTTARLVLPIAGGGGI